MGGLWEKITSPFKKPIKKIGDYFAPAPKVRIRDVVRETPKATLDVLQDMGQASWRGFASVASLITGKPFVPEGEFQKELYGTDKPITITSFGREARGADPEGKSEGAFKLIDPTIGLFFGAADAIPGGSGAKQGAKQIAKEAKTGIKAVEEVAPKVFKGFKDISTKVLESLKGRRVVSKQFISNLTSAPELKQAERDLLRNVLQEMPDDIPVQEFADQVKTRLLPLKSKVTDDLGDTGGAVFNSRELREMSNGGINPSRYEHISLPEDLRGEIAKYFERVYESPIKTSGGNIHFAELSKNANGYPNYFAHTRVEDLPATASRGTRIQKAKTITGQEYEITRAKDAGSTRRVIEIQSDLFQKGRLENEGGVNILHGLNNTEQSEYNALVRKYAGGNLTPQESARWKDLTNKANLPAIKSQRAKEVARLEPYRNTWWERVIREEIKTASKDGKVKLQFPTGDTAMKIEGLAGRGEDGTAWWRTAGRTNEMTEQPVSIAALREGDVIARDQDASRWRVTLINEENGDFMALPEEKYQEILKNEYGGDEGKLYAHMEKEGWQLSDISNDTELFRIGGAQQDSPIFRFYEKNVQKYLKKYGGQVVTDNKGVTWVEIKVPKDAGKAPVEAFGAVAGISETEDENGKKKIAFDPWKAAIGLGIIGGIKGVKGLGPDDLPKKIPKGIKLMSEIESLDLLAKQEDAARFVLRPSVVQEEKLVSNLESVFADLKGVKVEDLKTSFTTEDLEQAKAHYDIAVEMVMDNPSRQLAKYANKRTGELPEVLGKGTSIFGRKGDSIVTELGFQDSEQAREAY
ncbi:MAG: hypothetical protein WC654_06855 [Patescibacteria group bacterium]